MAKGQEIEELYISLGLNINDLKLGFDTAGKNVNAQMTSSILKKTCKNYQGSTTAAAGSIY